MGDQENRQFPAQQQEQPGRESQMQPAPIYFDENYRPSGKLEHKVALITGGDSGIGRAVAVLFAREGADVSIAYLEEHDDARETRHLIEREGRRAHAVAGDVGSESFCRDYVRKTIEHFGHIDILVNNSGEQHAYSSIEDLRADQLERTFRTNIFAMFFMVKAVLPHLGPGSAIVNSASVTAYQGHPQLLDYAATKGAIVSFTRSLALHLADEKIRVNAVAPGPVWTPLIPSSFGEQKVEQFGANTPLGRAGQPYEIAPCYLFLASSDASFMTGQVLHPNGGRIVNG